MIGGSLSDLDSFSSALSSSGVADKAKSLLGTVGKSLYTKSGSGKFTSFHDCIHGFDIHRNTLYMPEYENHGLTFFTRPKLNLTTPSLRADRILSLLDSLDSQSIAFAIRAQLDTNLTKFYNVATSKSPFFNQQNPFIPMLSNRLLTINGWPDWMMDVETTEGGFFSESITYPKGHDQLTRSYDLQASFADIQGSVILILFTMWFQYMHLMTKGVVMPYMEDIEARRMGFTSSIYRFVLDPSKRYILKWAKATGCFPRSVPLGAYFNYDSSSNHVESSMNLAIPFTVGGRVEFLDPIILKEFNMVVENRCPGIAGWSVATSEQKTLLNHQCIPYIDIKSGNNEIQWRYDSTSEVVNTALNALTPSESSNSSNAASDNLQASILSAGNELWA